MRGDAKAAIAASDFKGASALLGAAISANPKDATAWLALAKLGAAADEAQADGRYDMVTRGQTAAYAAFERASAAPAQAEALAVLGDLFARHEMWRPALDAYRASLERRDNEDTRKIYEDLREKHGFRILDYKVDNESSAPRVCFNFSEPLARKTDFAPYVAVAGASNSAISTEDQQICVEGLKHGERYAIVIREGLPSAIGESLLKAADYEIYVRDRSPQAHFAGKAYVLPRQGQLGAPLTTVNTAKVSIDVYRVGDRNLIGVVARDDFLKPISASRASEIESTDGAKVWSGSMDVASELNKEVVTDFPLLEAVGSLQPGVYLVTARPWKGATAPGDENSGEGDDSLATQWMVVSDIGLTTLSGEDGLHASAHSLATAAPLEGVEMRLIARNNEVLAVKKTGADGRVDFDPGLARGTGGSAVGLIVAQLGDDYGFLNLTQSPFDLTDRGVSGRDAPGALDAFLYTERGVYRSGETVFVAALLRDAKGEAKPGLPLTLVVKRPDGVEYKRASVADQGLGGRSLAVPLVAEAAPGTWTIDAFADPKAPAIGHAEFLLEDYVPERLDFTLKSAAKVANPGEPIQVSLDAKFLYGAPAAGLDVTGAIRLQAVAGSELQGYPDYVGGLTDDEFSAVETQFPDKVQTDAKGHADLSIDLPEAEAAKPLEAKLIVDVAESGGRTVERVLTLPVRSKGATIGVKEDFDESLGEGDAATFETIAVGPDGARVPRKGVVWSLYKITNDYQWYNADGRWTYEPVKSSRRIAEGTIDIGTDAPTKIVAQVGWGKHRLDLKSPDGEQTSVSFDVGWSGSASADTPDNVVVTLDKTSYLPGEEAKLRIAARAAGKATVALVGDKLERFIDVDLVEGDNTVPFKVGGDWGPGAYAVAITHRPLDVKAKRMPGRALGLAWFSIDEDAHKLEIAINAPEKTRPRGPLTLPIKINGLAPGEEAEVTVAAVDVGILNLTGYKTPDPDSYFFGQRKLAVDIRDIYGYLIDGMEGVAGAPHSGGDGSGNLEGNLPTQPPLALYSGVVKVGPDGAASVTFDIPAFNGAARVMAIAWSKTKVGSAEATVVVRDPVVVTATLPRFLNIGDRSQMHLDIDNVEGDAGDYKLDLDIHGPLSAQADALSKTVKLAAHQRTVRDACRSPPRASEQPGSISRFPGPVSRERSVSRWASRRARPTFPSGSSIRWSRAPSETITDALLARIYSRHRRAFDFRLAVRGARRAGAAAGARSLSLRLLGTDRQPRAAAALRQQARRVRASGCRPRSRRAHQGGDRAGDEPAEFQRRVWPLVGQRGGGRPLARRVRDRFPDARARALLPVPAQGFDSALDHLRNAALNSNDPANGAGEPLAYALYVLARNGRPIIGDLRYLADTKLAAFKTPMAQAQIGGALAMLGDRARAGKVFAAALADARSRKGQRPFAARLWLAPARRRGIARLARGSQSDQRRNPGRSHRARGRAG